MAKKYLDRINALREQYLNTRVEMDVYNAKYLTEGFKEAEGKPWILQKSNGYYHQCRDKAIYIQPHELLVGGVGFKPRAGVLCADSSASIIEKELDTISTRPYDPFYLSEEGKKVFTEDVQDYWKNKCVLDRWRLLAPKDMETLRNNGIIFIDRKAVRGYGENTPGWERILHKGLGTIRQEAKDALAKLDDAVPGDLEKMYFYQATIQAADGIILLANRHADLAEKMAEKCQDPIRKAELLKIAEVNRWVPEHPARNFYEAWAESISTFIPTIKRIKKRGSSPMMLPRNCWTACGSRLRKCPYSRMKSPPSMRQATASPSRPAAAGWTDTATMPPTNCPT